MTAGAAVDLESVEQPDDQLSGEDEESAMRELAACLKPLMRNLATADQEALRLVEFQGVTQVDAARRLGLSTSGMKSRVQRARLRLRSALEDCCRVALDARGGVLGHDGCGDQKSSCGCSSTPGRSCSTDPR
jgi:RNA polymerase sigma-70 factor (ECF subfamily)